MDSNQSAYLILFGQDICFIYSILKKKKKNHKNMDLSIAKKSLLFAKVILKCSKIY